MGESISGLGNSKHAQHFETRRSPRRERVEFGNRGHGRQFGLGAVGEAYSDHRFLFDTDVALLCLVLHDASSHSGIPSLQGETGRRQVHMVCRGSVRVAAEKRIASQIQKEIEQNSTDGRGREKKQKTERMCTMHFYYYSICNHVLIGDLHSRFFRFHRGGNFERTFGHCHGCVFGVSHARNAKRKNARTVRNRKIQI